MFLVDVAAWCMRLERHNVGQRVQAGIGWRGNMVGEMCKARKQNQQRDDQTHSRDQSVYAVVDGLLHELVTRFACRCSVTRKHRQGASVKVQQPNHAAPVQLVEQNQSLILLSKKMYTNFADTQKDFDMLEKNMGTIDRTLRILVGLGILSLVFIGPQTLWGLLGLIPIATGAMGSCPAYLPFGIKTCKA